MNPLPARPLGTTGLSLSRIGFGAGPLGGFYGPVTAEAGAQAARRAFDLGVRYFDVAPLYGHGRAELVLGHALRDLPRDSFVLSTKVGRYLLPADAPGRPARVRAEGAPFNPVLDYTREGTLRALEQSLLRLGTSRIDLVYIHDVDAHSQGDDQAAERAFAQAMAGAVPALLELKRDGVIRAVGVGLNQPHWALRWIREADLDALMIAGRLTLLNREAEAGLLAECARRNVGVVAAGAFNGGLLARGEASGWRFNYRPAPPGVIAAYERLVALARDTGTDLKAAAVQFPLRHPDVVSLVIGASGAAEVDENSAAAQRLVPDAFWSGLEHPRT
jgi:D-threo-aldose 1-dehydrogenase